MVYPAAPRCAETGMADGDGRAPAWWMRVVRISQVPVPWRDVVRAVISIVTPLAIGLAVEGVASGGKALGVGVLASIGGSRLW